MGIVRRAEGGKAGESVSYRRYVFRRAQAFEPELMGFYMTSSVVAAGYL